MVDDLVVMSAGLMDKRMGMTKVGWMAHSKGLMSVDRSVLWTVASMVVVLEGHLDEDLAVPLV
jgi:hypothetical protein